MPVNVDFATRTIKRGNFDHPYTAECFVNPDAYDFHHRSWNGRSDAKAWVILNAGYVAAIVFAEYYAYCDQDALDEAADSGKLDFLQVSDSELADYEIGKDSEGYPEYEGIINLGNASEPFDSQNLDFFTVHPSVFALDSVIAAVIERDSRNEAMEYVMDVQQAVVKDDDCDVERYRQVGRTIDYLRKEIEIPVY